MEAQASDLCNTYSHARRDRIAAGLFGAAYRLGQLCPDSAKDIDYGATVLETQSFDLVFAFHMSHS